MTELAELLQRQAALNQEISALRRADRLRAIDAIHALMAVHGLDVSDLIGSQSSKLRTGQSRKTVAAKYRDPTSGATSVNTCPACFSDLGETLFAPRCQPLVFDATLASGRVMSALVTTENE